MGVIFEHTDHAGDRLQIGLYNCVKGCRVTVWGSGVPTHLNPEAVTRLRRALRRYDASEPNELLNPAAIEAAQKVAGAPLGEVLTATLAAYGRVLLAVERGETVA